MPSVIYALDDPFGRTVIHELLEPRGYQVRVCQTAGQAMAEHKRERADAIIIDLQSPLTPGKEVLRLLRGEGTGALAPVLIAVGVPDEHDLIEVLSGLADEYLIKPVHPGELMAKLTVALRKRQRTSGQPTVELRPGALFAGRYQLLEQVGEGGYSRVYRSHDVLGEFQVPLALKVFQPPENPERYRTFQALYLSEAEKLINLDHPNIIRLFDFGQSGRYYYLALEFAGGQALDTIVAANGPLAYANVCLIGYEVASALEYMAKRCITHRDIKPDNVVITEEGNVKLLDFGLAKHEGELTIADHEGEFRGTAQFVAPEFIEGVPDIDERTDVYSLGVTLYFAVTGVCPFDAPSIAETLDKHFSYLPPALSEVAPEVPPEFSDLVQAMLAKNRADRPTFAQTVVALGNLVLAQGASAG